MTDLERAKQSLNGHTIALCRNGRVITDDKRGIAPMVGFISQGVNLEGYSVADLIVGKAVAMLFVKANIRSVFAKTLSESAADFLRSCGVPYAYETMTNRIINRTGDDICPMEKTVEGVDDVDVAYERIAAKLNELRTNIHK